MSRLAAVTTPRLTVRPLATEDVDELAAMFAARDVWDFEYGRGLTHAETNEFLQRQLRLWDEHGFGGCGVRRVRTGELIGVVGLAVPTVGHDLLPPVTVGWRFSPTAWGKGFATEAATAVLDQAFTTMGLESVGCVTNAENRRSIAVTERLGMTVITTMRVARDDGTGAASALLLQLRRDDWLARRTADGPGLA